MFKNSYDYIYTFEKIDAVENSIKWRPSFYIEKEENIQKDINHLLIISENGKVVLTYKEKEKYEYVKIVLSKKVFTLSQIFKKDFPQYKDNFPKQIIFLNKDKKPLMHVFFNEKGIIEKIVKINEEIIYQYNQN